MLDDAALISRTLPVEIYGVCQLTSPCTWPLLARTCGYSQDSNPSACHLWRKKKKKKSSNSVIQMFHILFCSLIKALNMQAFWKTRTNKQTKNRGQGSAFKKKFQTNYRISDAGLSNSSFFGQSLTEGTWNHNRILIEQGDTVRLFAEAPCLGAGDPLVFKNGCFFPVLFPLENFLACFPSICSFCCFYHPGS